MKVTLYSLVAIGVLLVLEGFGIGAHGTWLGTYGKTALILTGAGAAVTGFCLLRRVNRKR